MRNYQIDLLNQIRIFYMNRQSWHLKEDQSIKCLVQLFGCDNWTKISTKLKDQYQLHRTGKQCRQRWYNHLDPNITKKSWTDQQQKTLFQKHKQMGNRWKQISKHLEGRTDNDVKNHFYSTLRRSLRRLNKSMGQKNSTSQMRQIKPSALSSIMKILYKQDQDKYNGENEYYSCLKQLPMMIFQYSNYKPLRNKGLESEYKQKYMEILKIINQFNISHVTNKTQNRQKKTSQQRARNNHKNTPKAQAQMNKKATFEQKTLLITQTLIQIQQCKQQGILKQQSSDSKSQINNQIHNESQKHKFKSILTKSSNQNRKKQDIREQKLRRIWLEWDELENQNLNFTNQNYLQSEELSFEQNNQNQPLNAKLLHMPNFNEMEKLNSLGKEEFRQDFLNEILQLN